MVTLNLLSEVALIREPLTFEAGIYFVCIACILLTPIKKPANCRPQNPC